MRLKSHAAYAGESRAQIAIFGDSTAYVGLVPDVLESVTGMTAYNYSTLLRDGQLSSRLLLNNLMRNPKTRPEVIVLCWVPLSLALLEPPPGRLKYTYSHGNVGLMIEEFGFWGWVQSQIPTLRHQAFLRSLVLDRDWPTDDDFQAIDRAVELARRNKGWLAHNESVVYRGNFDYRGFAARFAGKGPVIDSIDRQISAILETAREHGIKVIALMAPIVPDSQDFYSMQPRWPQISGYFASQRARLPGILVLDVQAQFMDNRYFTDPLHLNGQGARKLSKIVGEAIAQRTSPDRG